MIYLDKETIRENEWYMDEGWYIPAHSIHDYVGPLPDLLTTAQAAAIIGVIPARVRRLAEDGRFPGARKHGRDWLIPRADVTAYADSPRRPGRPRRAVA